MSAKDPKKANRPLFASQLTHGRERFLAHAIEHGLDGGRRSPEDFIRHFPPHVIMEGLRDQPNLRARILVIATGVREKVASRKSATSAGDDLQIALDEGETDAETIVQLFDPDDRVRYLDHEELWAYVTEGDFWTTGREDEAAFDRAARHTSYLLDRALVDELITERDVIEGISVHTLAELLPRPELERVINAALVNAHRGAAFTDLDFLGQTPASTLVRHIPLPVIWSSVITPRIAVVHRYVAKPAPAPEPTPRATEAKPVATEPKPAAAVAIPTPAKPLAAVPAGNGGAQFRVARPIDPASIGVRAHKPRRSRPPSAPAPAAATAEDLGGSVDVDIEEEEP